MLTKFILVKKGMNCMPIHLDNETSSVECLKCFTVLRAWNNIFRF